MQRRFAIILGGGRSTRMGRDNTLVRIIQGPSEPDVASWHGEAWEKEIASRKREKPPMLRTRPSC